MPTLIKNLKNNRSVIFDTGKFDDWCVYIVEPNGFKNAPLDATYFSDLYTISQSYQNNKVYFDFVCIYQLTSNYVDTNVLKLIDQLVLTYIDQHRIAVEQWFTVLYAGMIAEENKQFAKLKKRIKRLGMHQVLLLNIPANDAALFSKGKQWRELDAIMIPYGF